MKPHIKTMVLSHEEAKIMQNALCEVRPCGDVTVHLETGPLQIFVVGKPSEPSTYHVPVEHK